MAAARGARSRPSTRRRQTEGFVASLIRLMNLDLKTPDHTTLSRRGATVEVPTIDRRHDGPIHLAIDSTGLKIMGDGEWHLLRPRPAACPAG